MKRTKVALALLALISIPVVVHADTAAGARKAIQARYDRLNEAIIRKDIQGVEATFTSDCVMQGDEGRTLRIARFLKQVKALFPVSKVLRASTKIVSIKADKDKVETVAEWNGESVFNAPGLAGKDEHPKPRKVSQTVRDTWKKTEKGWQIAVRIIEG